MHRMRTLTAVVGLTVAALVLAACGGGDDSSSDKKKTASGGGDLLIWVGTGPGGDATKKIGAAFGKENGVNVTVQVVPGDKLQAQFVTASQANKAPDVVMGAHDWIGNLVQNGTIDPIQIPADTQAKFQPLAIKAVTFNGQTYGMPYTMNNIVLFRNTALVKDAPKTVEEMVATGQKLKRAGKVSTPLAWPVSQTGNPYYINPLYTSGGGYMFGTKGEGDFDPSDLGVGTPGAVNAYKKISALGEKGSGVLRRSINTDNAITLFTSGKTPYLIEGPWQLTTLAKSKIKYQASAIPGFAGAKPAQPFITVDAAYVASKGKNKALAQEFVTNYWSRPDVSLELFKATQNVPANKEVLDQIQGSDPLVVEVSKAGAEFGQIMPSIPQMAAVWDPLGKAEAAVIGGANPASTVGAAAKTIQAAIK